ncbi:hypothetical protein WMY93_001637 [Mugilogobius chulae]|uniref:Uncharacterized protein n=1 Tax=Mugilogobius chulae TaxID=88201 RepID=A0AAW0PXA7_9GOBI
MSFNLFVCLHRPLLPPPVPPLLLPGSVFFISSTSFPGQTLPPSPHPGGERPGQTVRHCASSGGPLYARDVNETAPKNPRENPPRNCCGARAAILSLQERKDWD